MLAVNGSAFLNDTASVDGGAIAASSAALREGTELVYNVAKMDGGAVSTSWGIRACHDSIVHPAKQLACLSFVNSAQPTRF